MTVDLAAKRAFAESAHAYLRPLPSALDAKIAVFSAAMTAALLFTLDVLSERPDDAGQAGVVVASIGAALLILAVVLALLALFARTKGDATDLFSVVAFAQRSDGAAVINELAAKSAEDLVNMQLRHCRELAVIAMTKSRLFNNGLKAGVVGVVLASVGVILI